MTVRTCKHEKGYTYIDGAPRCPVCKELAPGVNKPTAAPAAAPQPRYKTKDDYTLEQKKQIALDAKARGCHVVAGELGLPMLTVRSWTNSLIGKRRSQQAAAVKQKPANKEILPRAVETTSALIPAAPIGELPPFPVFSDTWSTEVQLRWMDTYHALRLGLK